MNKQKYSGLVIMVVSVLFSLLIHLNPAANHLGLGRYDLNFFDWYHIGKDKNAFSLFAVMFALGILVFFAPQVKLSTQPKVKKFRSPEEKTKVEEPKEVPIINPAVFKVLLFVFVSFFTFLLTKAISNH